MSVPTHKTILLAGFEPFGEHDINPSQRVVDTLDGELVGNFRVKGLVLPVVFGEAGDMLVSAIATANPAIVVCLGLAADRKEITIERLAVNLDDARIPDNAGNKPVDQVILADAPIAYWATLPIRKMLSVLHTRNIPASLSMSAGTYVCNHVFFRLLNTLEGYPGVAGGFIHLPPLSDRIEDELPALTEVVKTLLFTAVDDAVASNPS